MRKRNGIKGDSWTPARAAVWVMVLFVEQWAAAPLGAVFPCVGTPIHAPQPTHPSTCSDTPLFHMVMANSYSFFKTSVGELAPQRSLITPPPPQRRTGCGSLLYAPSALVFMPVHSQRVLLGLLCSSVSSVRPRGWQHGGLLITTFQA